MERIGALVDVDGTLVDSNYHHTLAWSRALRDHGEDAPLAAIHRLVGMGGTELLQTLLGHDDDEVQQSWRSHFDALLPEVHAIDGAASLLHTLHEHGILVVLATSSPEDLVQALMAKVGAGPDDVDVVITASDVDRAKPNPDLFSIALERAGLEAEHALALGDSVWDVEAAGRAGVRTVGVETGGFSRFELEHAGAVAVYRHARKLADELATSPFGRLRAGGFEEDRQRLDADRAQRVG